MIGKAFVRVGTRQVHYRVAGKGPPIVLLHDSPRSSVLHLPQLEHFADDFEVVALDTPGYGRSDPLPSSPRPEVADFADALADTLESLGIERCPLYGFHTSSKIVLEFAVRYPARVSLAIMDGLNLPPGGPNDDFIARYMKPLVIEADGSHLAAAWARARDLHRFFPWFDTSAKARLPLELPDDAYLHEYAVDLLSAGANYSSAYSAAMRYRALPRLQELRAPAVFMCRSNDPLYSFLDVVEQQQPPTATVIRLPSDRQTWLQRLRDLFRSATAGAPPRSPPVPRADDRTRDRRDLYVIVRDGQAPKQVRLVLEGPRDAATPILLLHDPPGGSEALAPLASQLSRQCLTIRLDYPGEGESAALVTPIAATFAAVLAQALDALGIATVDVYARHWGTAFAAALRHLAPHRVRHLILDGPAAPSRRDRHALWKRYCPNLAPQWDGSHLTKAWLLLRDREFNWPWYARDVQSIRKRDVTLDVNALHAQAVAISQQPASYADAALAAIEYELEAALASGSAAQLLVDTSDVAYAAARRLGKRLNTLQVNTIDGSVATTATVILALRAR